MKFLITGLCLSRNLGGPAMALCLAERLRGRWPGCELRFAVSAMDMEAERVWAARYGLEVVPRDTLLAHARLRLNRLPPWRGIKRLLGRRPHNIALWQDAHDRYLEAFRWADRVINMEGVSYIGDGAWPWYIAYDNHTGFDYARRLDRPYTRFVQSFGPFDDWRVRRLARRELSRIPFVPARGRRTAEACRALVPEQEVFDVPDIAIALPAAEASWSREYLENLGLTPGGFAVVSPSSIVANTVKQGAGHVESVAHLVAALRARGEAVLLLPHMVSDIEAQCDRRICHRVLERLDSGDGVRVVEEDFGPHEMKGLIAQSRHAVVSRYHALVAAVSTATPVVALGWNDKYADQLEYYGLEDRAVDARTGGAGKLTERVLAGLGAYGPDAPARMAQCHRAAIDKVEFAFERLFRWIDDGR